MSNNTLIDKTAFDKAVSDYSDYHDKWAIAREDLERFVSYYESAKDTNSSVSIHPASECKQTGTLIEALRRAQMKLSAYVGALSQTSDPGRYWPELKSNIIKESEGSQLLGEIEKLKMLAAGLAEEEMDDYFMAAY